MLNAGAAHDLPNLEATKQYLCCYINSCCTAIVVAVAVVLLLYVSLTLMSPALEPVTNRRPEVSRFMAVSSFFPWQSASRST